MSHITLLDGSLMRFLMIYDAVFFAEWTWQPSRSEEVGHYE